MIPGDKKITIIPKLLINYINNVILSIKGDIEVDQIEDRKKYQLYTIKTVKKDINELFNNHNFWKNIMNINYCDYRYKNGQFQGLFCNKAIEIKTDDGKNHSRCAKHIGTKKYKTNIKRNKDDLCRSYNNTGNLCGNLKQYDNHCIYHYKLIHNIRYITDVDRYYNEQKRKNKPTLGKAYYNTYITKFFERTSHWKEYKKYVEISNTYNDLYYDYIIDDTIGDKEICLNCHIILDKYEKGQRKENDDIFNTCNECFYLFDTENGLLRKDIEVYEIKTRYGYGWKEKPKMDIISYAKNMVKTNIEDILYNNIIITNTYDSIDNLIEDIDETIKELRKNPNINSTNNKQNNIKINPDILIEPLILNNTHKIITSITSIINNKTYINIDYLEKSLTNYNYKFKKFKKEIHEDFPEYYQRIKGYFELMEDELDYDILRNIEIAKIKSIFI